MQVYERVHRCDHFHRALNNLCSAAKERLNKELERQIKVTEKERKAQEARERRVIKQREAAEKRALKEKGKEARKLQKEADKQLRFEKQASRSQSKASTVPRKRKPVDALIEEFKRVKVGTSRSGRLIATPQRCQE